MDVLVTGGHGAIGTYVTRTLREGGHDVTVLDVVDGDDDSIQASVTDAEAVAAAVDGTDAVVHLAALLPEACNRDPQRAERVNVGGTLTVFEAAQDAGSRVVYASSKAVLGPPQGGHGHPTYAPIGEDAPKAPLEIYGWTKQAIERYASRYRADGLTATGLRFASTYGPGKGAEHGALAMVPSIIRRAAAGETVEVSGGDQRNDFVYYGDIAAGVAAALETESPSFGVYHIGSGTTTTLREFGAVLEELTPGTVAVSGGLNFRGSDRPTYCQLDISRGRSDLGYDPAYDVERAVRDFLDWL